MRPFASLLVLFCTGAGAAASASVAQAHADLSRLTPELRARVRYLSLHNLPEADRVEAAQVLNGHCNSLSRESDLAPLQAVPGTAGGLLRVHLDDYGWETATWEKLAGADPWYHVQVETVEPWPGGVWRDEGKFYPAGAFTYKTTKGALAPWLITGPAGKQQIADVIGWTGSKAPIVRADWFFAQTAAQEGRRVGYYDFLGVKDQKGFEQLVRFDGKLAAKLEHRRVVVFSGITLQPRRVERTATVLGGLWRTFDNVTGTDKHNPLRVLDNDFQHDATEQFAPLPNGLPAWYLGNAQGQRQDKAPDNVVRGDHTGSDSRLHVNLSCVRCHFSAKEENAIKDVGELKIGKLAAVDYEKFRELRRQYLRDVAPVLKNDRANYAAAVKEATGGMDTQSYGSAYGRFYARYEDARVDLARAAADLEVAPKQLAEALQKYDATGRLDPVLSVIAGGGVVGVRQWEEVVPAAHTALKGVSP